MATKIRRCLYIGLGGTGMKSLLHAKKMFIDTYGEIPPMIGFLGIDTDGGEYKKTLMSAHGDVVELATNEQLQLHAPSAVEFYKTNKLDFSWVPETNINAIGMLKGLGAGGVRSNGRFAFTVNKEKIKAVVNQKLAGITNAAIVQNNKYELLSNDLPEIHIAFSICGGTGCGTFLNMAYILQSINDHFKTTGYAVLPGVFKALPACAHVIPNAYGALVDLDYLMHHGIGDDPIDLKYINEVESITEKPFANVMFIDNENDNNDHYDSVEDLTEMISLALVTAAGELAIAGASIGDNFNQLSEEGTMNILDKKAWAGGMGACEIIYRGETLAETYQLKAGVNIIDRMFNSCDDANTIANTWIDSSEVHIRENNGQNHVTDFVADLKPRYELVISNYKAPESEVTSNIETNKIKDKDLTEKQSKLLERVESELRKLLVANINRECGVSLAKSLIEEIEVQIGLCLTEMIQEKEDLVNREPQLKTNYEMAIADLKEYAGKFIATKSGKEQRANEIAEAVRQYNICMIDIQRHNTAITIYNSILVLLNKGEQKLQQIESSLKAVKQNMQSKIARLQNGIAGGSIFQINLAEEDAKTLVVNSKDILIQDFIEQLSGDMKVYGFTEYTAGEIEKFITNYTKTLNGAQSYCNRGVEEVLADINKRDPEKLKEIIQLAARKSLPLFRFNHRGHQTQLPLIDIMYVGVKDRNASILNKDNLFVDNVPNAQYLNATSKVEFASIGMTDKIIIYHQIGIVPIYALQDIYDYRKKYESSYKPYPSHHFDADLFQRMEEDKYSIEPRKTYAEKEEIVDLWVKGFIYGLIKNERGTYYIKSKRMGGLPGNQYWVKLDDRRTDAFKIFAEKEQLISKDFVEHIEKVNMSQGSAAIEALMADAKANEGGNYYEKYSQINLTMPTLQSRPYSDVWDLWNEELSQLEKL